MLIANKIKFLGCCVFIFSQQLAAQEVMVTGSQKPMPDKWIDKDTGHKIVRLTGKNNSPVSNWYFHNNPFFKQKGNEGDKMVFADTAGNARQVFLLI